MNKNDLIEVIAKKCEMSKVEGTRAVENVLSSITDSLTKGEEVRLIGFGTFSVYNRAKTTARNPQTGEPMEIPASKQPKFKAGKALKTAVNV